MPRCFVYFTREGGLARLAGPHGKGMGWPGTAAGSAQATAGVSEGKARQGESVRSLQCSGAPEMKGVILVLATSSPHSGQH